MAMPISSRGRIVAQRSRGLERGPHHAPPGILERGLEGRIELGAVVEAAIALADLRADLLEAAAHREEVEHLVGDEIGHALPVARQRLGVKPRHEILEALGREHGLVGSSGRVEGDLLLHRAPIAAPVFAVEGMDVEAAAHLARDAAHVRVHPGQVDRDAGRLDRPPISDVEPHAWFFK
jgi:hypothetical protein